MTEPAEGDGASRTDTPYLPTDTPYLPTVRSGSTGPAEPREPKGPEIRDALYVPGADSRDPDPETTFDAKAMVEAQKGYRPKPAYGPLPAATGASRAAAQQLRAEARRRRRRNRVLSRIVVLTVIGGLGAAGWFGYRAYQDDQQLDAEPSPAGDGSADEVASLSPPVTLPPEVSVQSNDEPSGDAASADLLADSFAARSVEFLYRRWEAAAAGSPMAEYYYRYDRVADIYAGEVRQGGEVTIVGADAGYRYSVGTDGVVERVRRNVASLDVAPDVALANVFRESDVLPEPARPFAVLEDSTPGSGFGDAYTYSIDTEQWRAADPGSYFVWVSRWNSRPANDNSLVDLATREISTDGFDRASVPVAPPPQPVGDALERVAPGAGLSYMIAPAGHVQVVTIIDNTADFRIEYYLTDFGDMPAIADFGERVWSPAP